MNKDNKNNSTSDMSNESDSKTRSKLTLKLNSSVNQPLLNQRSVTLKIDEGRKFGSSSTVQVTIKGRKKHSDQSDERPVSPDIAHNIEALKKEDSVNSEILQYTTEQESQVFHAVEERQKNEEILEKLKPIIPPVIEDKKVEIEEKKEEEEVVKIPQEVQNTIEAKQIIDVSENNSMFSGMDIRAKIQKSIEQDDIKKKEIDDLRAKRLMEKEVQVIETAAKSAAAPKPTSEQDRSKIKKYSTAKGPLFSDRSSDGDNKPGHHKKTDEVERFNKHKLAIIAESGDDGDFFSRRRRKPKQRQKDSDTTKEYKKISREILVPELITVSELAERMAEKSGELVKKLFNMGLVVTSNQTIDADTAEILATEFGHTIKRVSLADVERVLEDDRGNEAEKLERAPVVTIMGHVDHGKTSLLDAIRSTNVVSRESGGITQHIGASRIKTPSGKYITFLDTPGHEAFTEMRARGASATDIVVLVVAADDGVKDQTVEAISHARAANVPIIVAVNKIDKPGGNPQRVKEELLVHSIVAEDLGGDIMFVEVSAKQKLNLDKLEEAILLQSEILELKSAYEGKSSGVVIESRVDPAKGVVATLLVQSGTLDISDIIVVGTSYGKVRKMSDDKGKNIKTATPSMPVEVLGLNYAPKAGEKFVEVYEEKDARDIIAYRSKKERDIKSMKLSTKSVSDIFKQSGEGATKYLNVIIKADVHGSVEAIQGSLSKLSTGEVAIKVVHFATGGITETDIGLASVSNAIVLGFNVRATNAANNIAKENGVNIRYYSVIYDIVDDLRLMLSGLLKPIEKEEYLGRAQIRKVFKVSGIGKIAGGMVTDGIIKRLAKVRLLRDNIVIHDGTLKTLKRFKDDAKEVKSGFECGFSLENYDDIKEEDVIECYELIEEKRSI